MKHGTAVWCAGMVILFISSCGSDGGKKASDTDSGGINDTESISDSATEPSSDTASVTDPSTDSITDTTAPLDTDSSSETDSQSDSDVAPTIGDCADGIDNDSDGYVDWQYDLGCVNAGDDETSGSRDEEQGFTTFDVGPDSVVVYVSATDGDDSNDGLSPQTAVSTITQAAKLVADGANDFILLKRGDTWRGESLGRFVSGKDAAHPMVIASYGDDTALPRVEIDGNFIDHNGKARSFVSIVGIAFVSYPLDPDDPEYDGSTGGGFRWVGGGSDLLIESCRLTYCELVVQSYDVEHYENVSVRRNVIEKNYHINTCGQNSSFRPSGMYSSHVTGLTIEGNVFDHNGWNEEVESACATMYNHNMYLNANDLVIRDNIIARASSMGIKMRSDVTGDANGLFFENNLFVDGEIGLGIGGNTEEPDRFSNVTIRNNVFTQIGLSMPTDREFAWMLDVADVHTALIEGNYFLHQPWYSNAYGILLGSNSETDITVASNLFYNIKGRALQVKETAAWRNIAITGNTLVDPGNDAALVEHSGDFSEVTYQDNKYFSSAAADGWFKGDAAGDLNEWMSVSKETGAAQWTETFTDPERTVGTYAATIGLEGTVEGFMNEAVNQTRFNWKTSLTAPAVNNYIRAGFTPTP